MTHRRIIEVFTAGCPCCDEAVKLVQSAACPSCEVRILDMHADRAAQAKEKEYGIGRVPAIVIDGRVADCCQTGPVDLDTVRRLGIVNK